jgi:hypothetical protein
MLVVDGDREVLKEVLTPHAIHPRVIRTLDPRHVVLNCLDIAHRLTTVASRFDSI